MSTNERKGRLAAPHDSVELSTYRWRGHLEITYTAPTRDALIAANVLDDYMLQKIAIQKRGARKDAKGVKFQCWHLRGVWRLRREAKDMAVAMELPGIRELYPDGVPDWEQPRAYEDTYLERVLRDIAPACGSHVMKTRNKAVGRFQRIVEYVTVGPVVVPNWLVIRGEVLLARHSR